MTVTDGRPRILVVDDEETYVELLALGLENAGFKVVVARDGREAIATAEATRPHLVILDWMLPGLDGLQVCRTLRARGDTPILMLSARGDVEDRVEGLDNGADDYLAKPFKFKELLARVRAQLRRSGVSVHRILRAGDLTLNRDTREVTRAARHISLSPREFELLELLVSRPRQVFTREAILNRVWGFDFGGDTNIIDAYVRLLREKLDDHDRSLIQTVRGVGFTLRA